MGNDLALVMSQIEHTKRIDKKQLVAAIQAALTSAAKKVFGVGQEVEVEFDEGACEFRAYYLKEVVEKIEEPATQMLLDDARDIRQDAKVGEVVKVRIPNDQFGRIAAQTAKQVIVQRVQDAERQSVFDQFQRRSATSSRAVCSVYEGRNSSSPRRYRGLIAPPASRCPWSVIPPGKA
jgi:N utilization substance protein A